MYTTASRLVIAFHFINITMIPRKSPMARVTSLPSSNGLVVFVIVRISPVEHIFVTLISSENYIKLATNLRMITVIN
jgi:hypothetical protein